MSTAIYEPWDLSLDIQSRGCMCLKAWKIDDWSIFEITKVLRRTNDYFAILQEDELITISNYWLWVPNKQAKCFWGDTFSRHVSMGRGCASAALTWRFSGRSGVHISIVNSEVMWLGLCLHRYLQDALHRWRDKIRYKTCFMENLNWAAVIASKTIF